MEIFWNALQAKLVGTNRTLAEQLVEQNVFTREAYEQAKDIQKNGRPGETDNGTQTQPGNDDIDVGENGTPIG